MRERPAMKAAWKAGLLAFATAGTLWPRTMQGQTDTTHVTISGTVVDPRREPIEGVAVRLAHDTIQTFTTNTGSFRLRVPKSAEILIQFRRPGFNAQLIRMTGEWSGIVQLEPGAFALPDIQVTAHNAKPAEYASTSKYDDFFRRQRQGLGQFLTKEDLQRRNALHTPEIFEGQRGIKVDIQPGRGAMIAFARCNEYPPKINVYVDGRKQSPNHAIDVTTSTDGMWGAQTPRDPEIAGAVGEMVSRVNPSDIEFIEIFRGPGELPPEFNDGNCGAIAIWTHQGGR